MSRCSYIFPGTGNRCQREQHEESDVRAHIWIRDNESAPTPNNPPTEMASLREIKQRLAAIEQGQKETQEGLLLWMKAEKDAFIELGKKLDCLQGKKLLKQFQQGKRRKAAKGAAKGRG